MGITQVYVNHHTGNLLADVHYSITDGIVNVESVTSPINPSWVMSDHGGITDKELKRIHVLCCAHASISKDISLCPFDTGTPENETFVDEMLRLQVEGLQG